MLDRHDHLELLAFIEGELDTTEAAALRQRLAAEPRMLAAIDRVREDRESLRSLGEPELPRDFLAQLEPLLARPMLIETAMPAPPEFRGPGEFRRLYRRQQWRVRWSRVAAAAVVLLAVMVGAWAAFNGLLQRPADPAHGLIAADLASEEESEAANREVEAPAPLTGTIHHHFASNWPRTDAASTTTSAANSPNRATNSAPDRIVVAEFAVMMSGANRSASEQSLVAAASPIDRSSAVVRNFSYAEARRLAEEWRVAQGTRTDIPNPDPMASSAASPNNGLSNADMKTLADRVRARLNGVRDRTRSSANPSNDRSEQLAGVATLAPSLEQQLDLSSRGATHTLAVPASELKAVMQRLALAGDQQIALRVWTSRADDEAETSEMSEAVDPLAAWVREGAQVRDMIARLSHEPDGTAVLVPVVVHSDR